MESAAPKTVWYQRNIKLKNKGRGCSYITDQIISGMPEIKKVKIGLCNLFLMHTSASITLNENYDSDVKLDMEDSLKRLVPENPSLYRHTMEGKDDMPAHVKSALVGVSHTIPISGGKLAMGTWQGIWLCEHRDHPSNRTVIVILLINKINYQKATVQGTQD